MEGGYPYVQRNTWAIGHGNDRVISSRIETAEMASIYVLKNISSVQNSDSKNPKCGFFEIRTLQRGAFFRHYLI